MGFDLGGFGSMVGGLVGGMFGGPIGAQIGSMIGGQIGQMLSGMIGDFGMENVAGGLANCVLKDAASMANQHIKGSGFPQQLQDQMHNFVGDWLGSNTHHVPHGCQSGCNNIYIEITNVNGDSNNVNTEGNGGCARTDGNGMSMDDVDMKSCETTSNLNEEKEKSKSSGKKGGPANWLIELARALADIQTKFLDNAMKNIDTMKANADAMDTQTGQGTSDASGQESSRGDFMTAQAEYQANFQMFNTMSQMTATSLKSLGEGLSALARKQ